MCFVSGPRLAGLLFEDRHRVGAFVVLVADEANDRAWRRAALLYESALSTEEERQVFGSWAACELLAKRIEHFLPSQPAAVNHAVGGFQSTELAPGEAR